METKLIMAVEEMRDQENVISSFDWTFLMFHKTKNKSVW